MQQYTGKKIQLPNTSLPSTSTQNKVKNSSPIKSVIDLTDEPEEGSKSDKNVSIKNLNGPVLITFPKVASAPKFMQVNNIRTLGKFFLFILIYYNTKTILNHNI